MLREINIKNFALIEELHLELDPSFNVLTGETGAGKSIIIDALGLVLGGRFSSDLIRSGADTAVVEAFFSAANRPDLSEYLNEIGVPEEPDFSLLIQREINTGGKNRCRVNGQLVTVLTLNKLGSFLVDIHGQHEHQSLLFPEKQLELLDQYTGGDSPKICGQLSQSFKQLQRLQEECRSLQLNETELNRRTELLQFQIAEINQAKLVIGEDEDLLKEREILSSSEKLFAAASTSFQALYEGGENGAAVELLGEAERSLDQVAVIDPRLSQVLETLREAACQVEEVARELRDYQEQVQFDPERLSAIEDRLDEIGKLKRKYGSTIPEILQFAERCQEELMGISHREERLQQIQGELSRIRSQLGELAETLTGLRQRGAVRLERAIVAQLAELNMEKTQFKIGLTQNEDPEGIPFQGRNVEITATGADKIEFLVSPNPGESLKPMAKIASGGELSRIMLALKSILAELDEVPTMVFDEIDVGIGGRTAQAVAEKMLRIGQSRQVISVTHLPQIASLAKCHLYIEKQVKSARTEVMVRQLAMNERIEELSRMLGGAEVTETTRQHAREMLALAERLRLNRVGQVH